LLEVKILDFGLVREVKADTQLTEVGAVVGTPAYMSPEQARGKSLDHRTDLFSFGCVLYALCTGQAPFAADSPMAQAAALAADEPVRARKLNPNVPRALSKLIAELLAKKPDDRPQSAPEVLERLRIVASGKEERDEPPAPSRRHALALVAVVGLVLAALAVLALTRGSRPKGEKEAVSAPVAPVEYLSDRPKVEERVFPPPGAPRLPGIDGSVRVGGAPVPHGIFMHGAPGFGQPVFAIYSLDKKYSRFTAEVALNDSAGRWTGLIFVVNADGKDVWTSGNISAVGQRETCDIDVTGVNLLRLEVRTMGPHQGAHGAWIDPRLTK
jgi:hypothetical protein